MPQPHSTPKSLPLAIVLLTCHLLGAGLCAEDEAAQALLEWREDWPGVRVEVPVEVLQVYADEMVHGRAGLAPRPPVDVILQRGEYHAAIDGDAVRLDVHIDLLVAEGASPPPIPLLTADVPWKDVTVNGAPAVLRHEGKWLHLDDADQVAEYGDKRLGTVVVAARADLRGAPARGGRSLSLPAARTLTTVLRADSDQAWDVRCPRAFGGITGTEGRGTHGTLGLAPAAGKRGPSLALSWRPPMPASTRDGNVLYDAFVSWHLDDGVQEVRARFDVRVVGGKLDRLRLSLPDGADRVRVTGPDVREVQGALVHLKGRIRGATRLDVQFALPWPASRGRTELSGMGIAGGRVSGGGLVVSSGVGGVVLEEQQSGLAELGLWESPSRAAVLAPAPPVLAYALTRAGWRLVVDAVSLREMEVRETLIDRALYEVLLRPDGSAMHKVIFHVRNRNRQFLRIALPSPDDRLVSVRVSERVVDASRGVDGALLAPLDKSVETIGGALSFPVELVFFSRTGPLMRKGRLSLPLARPDVPCAQARCTLYLPQGFDPASWEGPLRPAEGMGEVVTRMEYGRGHRAPSAGPAPDEGDGRRMEWSLGTTYLRTATDYYRRGDLRKAEEAARKAIDLADKSGAAGDAAKLLEDITLATGQRKAKGRKERIVAEQQKQVMRQSQEGTVSHQKQLLEQGWEKAREGDEAGAAEAFQAAGALTDELAQTEGGEKEQDVALAESREWFERYQEQVKKNKELRERRKALTARDGQRPEKPSAVSSLKHKIAEITSGSAAKGPAWTQEAQFETGKVRARGTIATQRAGGKGGAGFGGRSLTAENVRLEHEVERLERDTDRRWSGRAPDDADGTVALFKDVPTVSRLFGQAPDSADGPVDLYRDEDGDGAGEALALAEGTAKELIEQKRFVEAKRVIEAAKRTGRAGELSDLEEQVEQSLTPGGANKIALGDLAQSEGEGKEFVRFLKRNYDQPVAGREGRRAADRNWLFLDGHVQVTGGIAGEYAYDVVENVRRNYGQKVAYTQREVKLDPQAAERLGARWNDSANGRWAVIDEGQLGALLRLEQDANADRLSVAKDIREIVPGTGQRLFNDAGVFLDVVRDDANTFLVDGKNVDVAHDRVLLVANDKGVVALRAGATQYWTEAPKAPEIKEAPAEFHVPPVGVQVRFEKLLLTPEDRLALECDYTFTPPAMNGKN